ncbi:helix-turn-helix domain-containing protein [Baekduia soli]|uniref:Helix-turn-helix domain-containing protein n=1 Tax=Baekduia soli TaxID=496014 RepID=A0A5B8U563_9ACTN|nr:helix-turn-helix domain-containing protein [Baekduia soli]QEC48259.1 helix-turn-helix domain-containing protein [Baekduia soli]
MATLTAMDALAVPHDELVQPTRARIFALLSDLGRAAGTDELAKALKLHPNGVRVHLDILENGGLVVRERVRQPRGRPRDAWTVSPTALPGGHSPSGYAELGRWLVRVLANAKVGIRAVETTGREIGRDLAPPPADDVHTPEQRLHGALAALGFQPTRSTTADDRMTYCLGNCPYRAVAREQQSLVCALHRGITRGLLDGLDPKTKLVGFTPKDPDEAGCLIELRGPMAKDATRSLGDGEL